jgi:hypothetical protein
MKRQGCLLKLAALISLIVLLVGSLWGPVQVPVRAQGGGAWVEVLNDGERVPLQRATDLNCAWTDSSPALINRPGECGRPTTAKNVYMVYSHNMWCDAPGVGSMCHYSRTASGVFAWGALKVDDPVELYDGAHLWRGKVVQVIRDAGTQGINPQDEFTCPKGATCGVLTTCADLRPAYVVVRVAYHRAR